MVTHYLPLGPEGEKGIDVWLALEAYELAIHKRFDVIALIACDGDFLPLVRKLNTVGTRVMLLAWDFQYTDQNMQERETRTAQVLLDEVTYPVLMRQLIDDPAHQGDPLIEGLFVKPRELPAEGDLIDGGDGSSGSAGQSHTGRIKVLKEGYGFIAPSDGGDNIFFYHGAVLNADFNDLRVDDESDFPPAAVPCTSFPPPCHTARPASSPPNP